MEHSYKGTRAGYSFATLMMLGQRWGEDVPGEREKLSYTCSKKTLSRTEE